VIKAEFSAPLCQSSVSHDPTEISLINKVNKILCSRIFYDYYHSWKQLCCFIFMCKPWFNFFFKCSREKL